MVSLQFLCKQVSFERKTVWQRKSNQILSHTKGFCLHQQCKHFTKDFASEPCHSADKGAHEIENSVLSFELLLKAFYWCWSLNFYNSCEVRITGFGFESEGFEFWGGGFVTEIFQIHEQLIGSYWPPKFYELKMERKHDLTISYQPLWLTFRFLVFVTFQVKLYYVKFWSDEQALSGSASSKAEFSGTTNMHCDLICFPSNAFCQTAGIAVLQKINTIPWLIIPRFGKCRPLREKNMIHELSHLTNGPASSKVTIADGGFRHFLSFLVLSPLLTTRKQKERRKSFPIFNPRESIWQEGRP